MVSVWSMIVSPLQQYFRVLRNTSQGGRNADAPRVSPRGVACGIDVPTATGVNGTALVGVFPRTAPLSTPVSKCQHRQPKCRLRHERLLAETGQTLKERLVRDNSCPLCPAPYGIDLVPTERERGHLHPRGFDGDLQILWDPSPLGQGGEVRRYGERSSGKLRWVPTVHQAAYPG